MTRISAALYPSRSKRHNATTRHPCGLSLHGKRHTNRHFPMRISLSTWRFRFDPAAVWVAVSIAKTTNVYAGCGGVAFGPGVLWGVGVFS